MRAGIIIRKRETEKLIYMSAVSLVMLELIHFDIKKK